MPIAESELNFENEYQLIVAVMLSAQCTDKRVNMVTPAIALTTVGEAMDYWQKNKKWAWLFIGAAVISMVIFVLEM